MMLMFSTPGGVGKCSAGISPNYIPPKPKPPRTVEDDEPGGKKKGKKK